MIGIDNIPETVRLRIDAIINKATADLHITEESRHMMTQICFEMFQSGWRHAFKTMRITLDRMEDCMK